MRRWRASWRHTLEVGADRGTGLFRAGRRLLAAEAPATGFRLVESTTTSTGATYAALAPAPFTTGGIEAVDGKEQLV